ncbi:MAG: transporter substrate-binding domain-containing protein [Nevskiaceae bacterium]|nr:MAG: transporter substrate-binding domain-containing protein [Nevskiaceae bacterium]TBR71974.1 MAG: transporter substrate-binding domain-containing protein [Nevskiaceae bacterium]
MTELYRNLLSRCASLSAAAVLLYGGVAGAATPLSVCLDSASPTAKTAQALATAVAHEEGRSLKVYTFDSSGDDEGYDVGNFSKLAHKHCDLVMDFPVDTDATSIKLPGVHITKPYAHTGFVLVTPKAVDAKKLEDLPKGSLVSVTYLTTPNIYFESYPELSADVERNTYTSLDALVKGQVQAAMLWRPAVVQALAKRGLSGQYVFNDLTQPHSSFNLVALYAEEHAADAAEFEKVMIAMQSSGELAKILGPFAAAGPLPTSAGKSVQVVQAAQSNVVQVGDAFAAGSAAAATKGVVLSKTAKAASAAASAGVAKPALYTEAQAQAGHKKYMADCAQCHGDNLEGFVGPALTGRHFAPVASNFHVKDIFSIISKNMPATQPGSLSQDDYVDIMSWVLHKNGYPAGDKALTFGDATRSALPFVSQ